jgi:23S rRNA (adenine2503-C2)-methyltransferase
MGEPAYRGEQIFTWLHKEGATDYASMSNIGKPLRLRLAEEYPLIVPTLIRRQESVDGTKKYLFSLGDGARIESVLMSHREDTGHIRHTACLSSQVGCPMGCVFCATAGIGYKRSLTAGEISGQLLAISGIEGIAIHNAVYMGMGEPLLNEEAVKRSVLLLNHPMGQNISARRITISTCGLPDGIRRLAGWGFDVVLAVSLHGADDGTRSRLMPVNQQYPLSVLLEACRDYTETTGRRITFEYIMIRNLNIGDDAASALGQLLQDIPCNINLIPVNPGPHGFIRPGRRAQARFCNALEKEGLNPVIRQERGADIDGACGQLAGRPD